MCACGDRSEREGGHTQSSWQGGCACRSWQKGKEDGCVRWTQQKRCMHESQQEGRKRRVRKRLTEFSLPICMLKAPCESSVRILSRAAWLIFASEKPALVPMVRCQRRLYLAW